jgi:hypothetical protein
MSHELRVLALGLVAVTTWAAQAAWMVPGAQAQDAAPAAPPGYVGMPASPGHASHPPPTSGAAAPIGVYQVTPGAAIAPPAVRARRVEVERSEAIRGLWLPALIVLPVAWVTTWTLSSSAFEGDALTYSWIPVVGPWLMLSQNTGGHEAGIIVSGVVQAAATLALVLGLTLRRTWVEHEYVIEPVAGARIRLDAISLPGGGMVGAQVEL